MTSFFDTEETPPDPEVIITPEVWSPPYETYPVDYTLFMEERGGYWTTNGPWADLLNSSVVYRAIDSYPISELISMGVSVYEEVYEPQGLTSDIYANEISIDTYIVKLLDKQGVVHYIPRPNLLFISAVPMDMADYYNEEVINENELTYATYPKVGEEGIFTAHGYFRDALVSDTIYLCTRIELLEEICTDRKDWLFTNYYEPFERTMLELEEDVNSKEVLVTVMSEHNTEVSILGSYIHSDVGGDSNSSGAPPKTIIRSTTSVSPKVGSRGVYTASGPFASVLNPQLSYECISVETIDGLIANGDDPFGEVYSPVGLTNDEMMMDAANGETISTLQGSNGSIVKIPTKYLNGIPNSNGVKYSCVMLGISLSALPDDFDLTELKQEVSNLIFSKIGIRSEVKSLVFGSTSLISQENHRDIEMARMSLITNTQTSSTEINNLRTQNSLLINKVDQLENYIKTTL